MLPAHPDEDKSSRDVSSLPRTDVHWAISAPAAFLRTMSRLACSFSGVVPKYPGRVTSMVGLYPTIRMMHWKPLPLAVKSSQRPISLESLTYM